MTRALGTALVLTFVLGRVAPVPADEPDARATIDKAIQALGGEEKLGNAKAVSWKGQGTLTFNDNSNDFDNEATYHGLDHYRGEFDGEFNGNSFHGVTVLNGDEGWRKFGDQPVMEMDDVAVANEKRSVYLQLAPVLVTPLKDSGFKLGKARETKVSGTEAVAVEVTGPDGKTFTIDFGKDSGLPIRVTAEVAGFQGDTFTQETTYADYKDFGGIKKATKVEVKRDGDTFLEQKLTEFKVLDKVDPDTFSEPD